MTVFIQQLGRGLRLDRGKDCLTVLDFVAQANKKYNFAGRFTALLGKKDVSIKKEIEGGFPHVPKGCAIQLEKVAQERILDNIRKQLSRYDFYKELVLELRDTLGKVPTAAEFFEASKVELHVFTMINEPMLVFVLTPVLFQTLKQQKKKYFFKSCSKNAFHRFNGLDFLLAVTL